MKGRTGAGGVVLKRCGTCHREALSAWRGEVTSVGNARIVKVDRVGNIHAVCECGSEVIWERAISHAR